MKILGYDSGYGDQKIVYSVDGIIQKMFKFPSVLGITKKNENVPDDRIYKFRDSYYYVGNDASHIQSDNLISIADYKTLEFYAPLMLHHMIKQIGDTPDIIVAGLSISQINNSGYFKEALMKYSVNDVEYTHDNVFILPQGAGIKLTIDKYGHNYPVKQQEDLSQATYIIADIGMNTLDLLMVTKGKTSPNLFEGIEKEGITKIATLVAKKIKELHGRSVTLHEAKEVIDTGFYKLRGKTHPFREYVDAVKKEYLKDLLTLIESKYGKVIDKCDFLSLNGGGSAIFKSTEDGFIKIPKEKQEYGNAIGYSLFGETKAQ